MKKSKKLRGLCMALALALAAVTLVPGMTATDALAVSQSQIDALEEQRDQLKAEREEMQAGIDELEAQQADVLVMDEPTAALDFGNQQLVLSRMSMLSRMGKAVVMVTHDPDHALFCADRVIVMDAGRVLAQGTPAECITTEMLARIYGTDARVVDVELDGGLRERVCVPVLAR